MSCSLFTKCGGNTLFTMVHSREPLVIIIFTIVGLWHRMDFLVFGFEMTMPFTIVTCLTPCRTFFSLTYSHKIYSQISISHHSSLSSCCIHGFQATGQFRSELLLFAFVEEREGVT